MHSEVTTASTPFALSTMEMKSSSKQMPALDMHAGNGERAHTQSKQVVCMGNNYHRKVPGVGRIARAEQHRIEKVF